LTTEKPGKKEKIRFGKAPTKTLPVAASSTTEDAGAAPAPAAGAEPANPLEASRPTQKSRFSARATAPKKPKVAGRAADSDAPAPPDAAEVADRQSQAAPLGLSGDTSKKKKKKTPTTTGDKTRLADKSKKPDQEPGNSSTTPAPQVPAPQAPAPQQ
jgi:peptidyl-prolyl cis-trans isomerase SurA